MRREFQLPQADESFVNTLGRPWETVIDGSVRWLLIHDRVVPTGYTVATVSEAYRIDTGYPDTQIDMVYFQPSLQLSSGKTIGALSTQQISGSTWQRWSRHREPSFPWRPGVDDLSSHVLLVDHWLDRELAR
jgi:hypothetical protein